jgi:hypothetical protein
MLILIFSPWLFVELSIWGYCGLLGGKESLKNKYMAWREVISKRKWIINRRKGQNKTSVSLKFWLQVFYPTLKVGYISPTNNKSTTNFLAKIFEQLGWITALPTMMLARLFIY